MQVLKVDYSAKNAPELFTQSLKDTGFGVLYNHPVDQELIDDVYQEWEGFFASDYKKRYLFNRETQDGFFPIDVSEKAKGYSEKDLKEYFQIYPWGLYPAELSDKTKRLYQALNKVAVTLLKWVEAYSPEYVIKKLSMPLSQMIEDSESTMLRIIHYPPLTGGEPADAVRAAAHGDINLLTVLVGATASGLQVLDMNNQWYDVPCDRACLVVNIGDMLEMCTEGTYRSTLHRVINPADSENISRLSMPLFLHPHPEVVLSEKHTAGSFLKERLIELGVV